jgi:hypothetical protein
VLHFVLETATHLLNNRQNILQYLTGFLQNSQPEDIKQKVHEILRIAEAIDASTPTLEEILKTKQPVPHLYEWAKKIVDGGQRNYKHAYEHAIAYAAEPPYEVYYEGQLNNTGVRIAIPDRPIVVHHNHPGYTIAPLSRGDCKFFF